MVTCGVLHCSKKTGRTARRGWGINKPPCPLMHYLQTQTSAAAAEPESESLLSGTLGGPGPCVWCLCLVSRLLLFILPRHQKLASILLLLVPQIVACMRHAWAPILHSHLNGAASGAHSNEDALRRFALLCIACFALRQPLLMILVYVPVADRVSPRMRIASSPG